MRRLLVYLGEVKMRRNRKQKFLSSGLVEKLVHNILSKFIYHTLDDASHLLSIYMDSDLLTCAKFQKLYLLLVCLSFMCNYPIFSNM
jgi:hypothetical protein